ncbi:unnamed protein product [Hyaloperonospora brassicae]|uniref:HTH myb-type domain-containing protein n=1 Tax=Hyaloperonospora brassicae TaxID=162125 RepID=A0AAV0ULI8_HYABA|nr:unnamed protein product [Hyaloperonospora brassicae]
MYTDSDCDRPLWQHQTAPLERVPPLFHAQADWFSLQEASPRQLDPAPLLTPQQLQQQSPVSSWSKDTGRTSINCTTGSRHDAHEYGALPLLASELAPAPLDVWTNESDDVQSPRPQTAPFQSSPLRVRPEPALADTDELYTRLQDGKPFAQQQSVVRRRSKQIAVGRWHSDEHEWFLKGLEMFQGPAWGEIARLIGTRTSTQVRTHAQKFFTKLARLNQTMPHFELQIQKERARLVAQGASSAPHSAQGTAPRASLLATLSPCKHLDSNGLRQPRKAFSGDASLLFSAATEDRDAHDVHQLMLPRGDVDSMERAFASPSADEPLATAEWPPHHSWTSCEGASLWPLTSPTSPTASLQLTAMQMDSDRLQHALVPSVESDVDSSLPSMTKLLYRSSATSS